MNAPVTFNVQSANHNVSQLLCCRNRLLRSRFDDGFGDAPCAMFFALFKYQIG
jgi:hypothetical protein